MKKHFVAAISLTVIFFSSCKEKGNLLLNTGATTALTDTTYVITPETQQPRNVLVEEYTGVQCTNCPKAAEILKAKQDQYPNRVIVIGMHEGAQSDPIEGVSKYDLRCLKVSDLMSGYFGEKANKPTACFDRTKYQGVFFSDRPTFAGLIDSRIAVASPANMYLTTAFADNNRVATIKLKVVYNQQNAKKQNITVAIIENNIVDIQEFPSYSDTFYVHKHVLRDIITPYSGSLILKNNPSKEPGRVYERTLTYTVDKNWKAENCMIVAFVHNDEGQDKEVLQAVEAPLKP